MDASESDLLTVTVVAPTATEADVLAKVAFLAGSSEGPQTIERFGAEGLVVALDSRVIETRGLSKYLA